MLAQLGNDRVGHDLATVDFSRLISANGGVPSGFRIAMHRHAKITRADALLYDLFEFRSRLLLHANFFNLKSGVSLSQVAGRWKLVLLTDPKQ